MEEQFIGSYRVLKKIGAGGMAKVYLAVHQDVPNLKVILKVLSDPRLGQRFKQEADKLALLEDHPNICRIKGFLSHGEDTVIAMEYIEGITLEEKIKKEGRLSLSESLQIISDVVDVLDFAHRKGTYHRDIKPSNIMIDKKGRVKIIDFGIAKAETDPNLTVAGSACGTPAYMAPEQFTPTQDTNYALVDIYAAGTTLYTMLTGECPFKGDNEFAIRDSKLFSEVAKPRSVNPDIPKQVEEIIMKSLAKEPGKRFQSASEMQAALDAVRGTAKDNETILVHPPPSPPMPPSRKWLLRAAAALVIVAVAAWAVNYFAIGQGKTGTIEISVVPHGDVYVDNSLLGMNVTTVLFTGAPGRHVIRVHNDEAVDTTRSETVWLTEDSVLKLPFEFTIPPPTGTIDITAAPFGDIYVDGNLLGRGLKDTSLICDTGRHIIRVENRKATRKMRHDTVWLAADEIVSRAYTFTFPKPPVDTVESEPAFRDVVVVSNPRGAYVYIDGKQQHNQTPYTFKFTPGEHVVKVKKTIEGEELEQERTILVGKDGPDKVVFDFEK